MIEAENWKIRRNQNVIAQILRFEKGIEQAKITNKALDGTFYIQTIGAGTKYADIEVLCSRSERDLLNNAEADGVALTATYRNAIYVGYIEKAPNWQTIYPGEWYSAKIKLIIESEVAA